MVWQLHLLMACVMTFDVSRLPPVVDVAGLVRARIRINAIRPIWQFALTKCTQKTFTKVTKGAAQMEVKLQSASL